MKKGGRRTTASPSPSPSPSPPSSRCPSPVIGPPHRPPRILAHPVAPAGGSTPLGRRRRSPPPPPAPADDDHDGRGAPHRPTGGGGTTTSPSPASVDRPSSRTDGTREGIHDDALNRGPPPTDRRRVVVVGDRAGAVTQTADDDDRPDGATELSILDCRVLARPTSVLLESFCPRLASLALVDGACDPYDVGALEDLEAVVSCLGALRSLVRLEVEFEYCVVDGCRLSSLAGLRRLEHLRLRGFDLSDGIAHVGRLRSLRSLHLCHGNARISPDNDVDERHLLALTGMTDLRSVHLENFDGLSDIGMRPFFAAPSSVGSLVLRHCQGLDRDCLSGCGRSRCLTSLHVVHGPCDDVTTFDREGLRHLNALTSLRSLSLLRALGDLSDLVVLRGMASLETLNIALDGDLDAHDFRALCRSCVLPTFPSLRRLRIFSEEDVSAVTRAFRCGRLDVEFGSLDDVDSIPLD
ncbi:hypothetical protein ACHAW5_005692 [Stephanodiscus triporus]|uniref:Uncharacterized protein n=1 Tax=Stephanodiscus triporus TaxID=2934178 RepID=A0ABD3MNP6_9STRA